MRYIILTSEDYHTYNPMHNVIIIGAGNIGRRHLQGLKRLSPPCTISVVDPDPQALECAKQQWADSEGSHHDKQVSYHQGVPNDARRYDVGIIATNATNRMESIRALLQKSDIESLILEKFLFVNTREYSDAAQLFQQKGVAVFVNCPMRTYPHYQKIKNILSKDRSPFTYRYEGSRFGILSNTIHHMDLFSFLSVTDQIDLNVTKLDGRLHPSKRLGYVESYGRITGYSHNGDMMDLVSFRDGQYPDTVFISNCCRQIILNFKTGMGIEAHEGTQWKWVERTYGRHLQNKLTTNIVEDLLQKQTCQLPSYQNVATLHLALLQALQDYYQHSPELFSRDHFPIT